MALIGNPLSDEVTTQFGTVYPNAHTEWSASPVRDSCDIRTQAGQNELNERFRELVLNTHISVKGIPPLRFLKRTRTVVYSDPETFEAL